MIYNSPAVCHLANIQSQPQCSMRLHLTTSPQALPHSHLFNPHHIPRLFAPTSISAAAPAMTSDTPPSSGTATPIYPASSVPQAELKILMLHVYTPNGPVFHAKPKALEKYL